MTTVAPLRLNKYLATMGVAARRKIDALVEMGKIQVNGIPAKLGQMVTPGIDVVMVNGKKVDQEVSTVKKIYYALHKPVGVVSTVTDPEGRPTVMQFFKGEKSRLYPVGRLDQESEGLIIMTNDGELAQRLTHPRFHLAKTYLVWVSGEVTERKLQMLEDGVRLKDGRTAPCEIEATQLAQRRWSLVMTLHQGKNRQIRRMLPYVELEVLRLKRIQFGPVSIGALKPGEWKKLSDFEISVLREECGLDR